MTNHNFDLDDIRVASPCPASWEGMTGDDRVRFCGECKLNVYNLSAMSRGEAEQLVRNREKRLCVRFYRREDGTVLSRDCPVGLRNLVRRGRARVAALASLALAFLFGCGRPQVDQAQPLQGDVYVPQGQVELGEVYIPVDAQPSILGRVLIPSDDLPGGD